MILRPAILTALLVACEAAMVAQGLSPEKVAALPAFMDATVPKLMEQGRVVGTAVAVVHRGRIILLRGYGESRLDTGASVDASRTLFRIGSVSKVLTTAAALQMVETGALDLHRDVRAYLPDVALRYGATTHQLLTHTAGLGEKFAGAFTGSPAHLQTLSEHFRRYPPTQAFPPGSAYSYSSYNYALAGLLVERLSGLTYEEYMADRIFRPLKMTATTAHQPPAPNLTDDLARGYRAVDGRQEALAYRFTQTGPAGGISASAADIGRFMLAVLGDGSLEGGRILSPESVALMFAPQYTPDPRIPPRAYAFLHWVTHGQRLMHHDGTLGDQIGVMVLAPADRFGIFVASNGSPDDGNQIGNQLLDPLLAYLVGPAAPSPPPPAPLPGALRRARRFGGTYRDYHHTRNDMSRLRALMPMIQSRVIVESDGAIRWKGQRWLEVEPLVFRSADSPDHIVFREDGQGAIVELHAWGATYERIGWAEQAPFHLGLLASCVIACLAYLVRTLRTLRRRGTLQEGRLARGCAVFVATTNLAFVVGLALVLREFGSITPLPLPIVLWLSLPAFAGRAWSKQWWTRGERVGYSTLAVFAAAFIVFLNYWKLLGFRY